MNSEKSTLDKILNIISVLAEIALIIAGINFIIANLTKRKYSFNEGGAYYTWRLGKIFYKKQGQGKPMLIIHGLEPASSIEEIKAKASALAEDHTVYTIDLLGFGRSDKPWITYTNYIYVLLINDFIENVIMDEDCDVVAYEGSALSAMQAHKIRGGKGKLELINPYSTKAFKFSKTFALKLKNLFELPLLGTFLYNMFCIGGSIGFDTESKYVLISRLSGHLETDISGHSDLMGSNVEISHQ